jgi:chromosome segregation ATPase
MKRSFTILMLMLLAGGCSSTPREDPVSKREQDRLAMKLADAQRERDELKGQLKTLSTTTEQALAAQKTADAKATRLEQEATALRANSATMDQLKTELASAQAKLADSTGRIKELTTQVEALKAELAKAGTAAPKPATPEMNK